MALSVLGSLVPLPVVNKPRTAMWILLYILPDHAYSTWYI